MKLGGNKHAARVQKEGRNRVQNEGQFYQVQKQGRNRVQKEGRKRT